MNRASGFHFVFSNAANYCWINGPSKLDGRKLEPDKRPFCIRDFRKWVVRKRLNALCPRLEAAKWGPCEETPALMFSMFACCQSAVQLGKIFNCFTLWPLVTFSTLRNVQLKSRGLLITIR